MLPPVRDHSGHAVWRVRVAPGEMTCVRCGEVMMPSPREDEDEESGGGGGVLCVVCGSRKGVPTLSYLREDEVERMGVERPSQMNEVQSSTRVARQRTASAEVLAEVEKVLAELEAGTRRTLGRTDPRAQRILVTPALYQVFRETGGGMNSTDWRQLRPKWAPEQRGLFKIFGMTWSEILGALERGEL